MTIMMIMIPTMQAANNQINKISDLPDLQELVSPKTRQDEKSSQENWEAHVVEGIRNVDGSDPKVTALGELQQC